MVTKLNYKMNKIIFSFLLSFIGISNSFGYAISDVGKKHIQVYERLSLVLYKDGGGYSIGWGHHLLPGESYTRISKAKADKLFNEDIAKTNKAINRILKKFNGKVKFSQAFIDGLGDLIYNCGEHGVTLTEFWNRWERCRYDRNNPGFINQNDLNFTIAAVKTSRISAKGHISRRYDAHKMMLN